uniref:Uncharacterized protein n=1 Tax=Anguilla anguilla TaxID=7936 RepID=A0A0E9RV59_ANGAN
MVSFHAIKNFVYHTLCLTSCSCAHMYLCFCLACVIVLFVVLFVLIFSFVPSHLINKAKLKVKEKRANHHANPEASDRVGQAGHYGSPSSYLTPWRL